MKEYFFFSKNKIQQLTFLSLSLLPPFPTDSSRSYASQNELIEIELQQKIKTKACSLQIIYELSNDFRNKDIAEGEL